MLLSHNCYTIEAYNITIENNAIAPLNFINLFGYASSIMCVIGITTNAANIVVLNQPTMVTPTNFVLSWLAVADLLTMLSYLPSLCHFYLLPNHNFPFFTITSQLSWAKYQQFMITFVLISHSSAVWLTVLLALIRHVHLHLPVKGPRIANLKNTAIVIGFLVMFCFFLTIPNMLINEVKNCTINLMSKDSNSSTIYQFYEIRSNNLLQINFWIQSVVFKILPTTLLTILTSLLILKMQHIGRKRSQLLSKNDNQIKKRENRVTLMLLMVVILFLLIEMPHGILMLGSYFSQECYSYYSKFGDLIDFLTLVNESINFILYTTMSKQFRRVFIQIFCPVKLETSSVNRFIQRVVIMVTPSDGDLDENNFSLKQNHRREKLVSFHDSKYDLKSHILPDSEPQLHWSCTHTIGEVQ